MKQSDMPKGFQDMLGFSLTEALLGRRSRRFFMGAEIPDGVFAYKSQHEPMPLSEIEKMLVVGACGGNTSWRNMICRGQIYTPYLSNYAGAAGGRVFPSAAGFHTSQTFFTDDDGLYLLEMRDAPAFDDRADDGSLNLDDFVSIEKFKDIVDVNNVWPITFVEQWSLAELTVEIGSSCYAGALMLQAMGLGGWMFNGVDPKESIDAVLSFYPTY